MKTAKIACILLNYRRPEEILPLLESVRRCEWLNKEIYIVENGTGSEAVDYMNSLVGSANVISTPLNLGFAGGMNLGIRHALAQGADFVWCLSKDMTVEKDCLQVLHSLWSKLDNPGLVGSLTDLNGTDQVYFFRALIDRHGHSRHGNKGRNIGQIPELKNEFGPTDYVNGSCIFTHRTVLERTSLIPEDYFLYFEDCEFGLNAKRAGFNNYVSYKSRVHHRRALGEFNRTAEYYCRRNIYLFKKRNGFERPWTKCVELMKVKKALLKSRWRGNSKMTEILKEVEADMRQEKIGPGRWR
jgi:GT2 family glycosyltransferase